MIASTAGPSRSARAARTNTVPTAAPKAADLRKFLFWAVIAGFVTIFPTLYIPVINHDVFKHTGIGWEWGIVFVEAVLFFLGIEAWKWGKRVFFRRRAARLGKTAQELETKVFEKYAVEVGEA